MVHTSKIIVDTHIFIWDILGSSQLSDTQVAQTVSQYANAINRDPADRIIAATTMVHNAILLTEDNNLKGFEFLKTSYP